MPKPGGRPKAGGKGAAKDSGAVSKSRGPRPPPPAQTKSIGQLTSHIGNKQKRSETYAKLKHKKQVFSTPRQAAPCPDLPASLAFGMLPLPAPASLLKLLSLPGPPRILPGLRSWSVEPRGCDQPQVPPCAGLQRRTPCTNTARAAWGTL